MQGYYVSTHRAWQHCIAGAHTARRVHADCSRRASESGPASGSNIQRARHCTAQQLGAAASRCAQARGHERMACRAGPAHRIMVSYSCGSTRMRARAGSCSCCSLAISSAWNTWRQGGIRPSHAPPSAPSRRASCSRATSAAGMQTSDGTRHSLTSNMLPYKQGERAGRDVHDGHSSAHS